MVCWINDAAASILEASEGWHAAAAAQHCPLFGTVSTGSCVLHDSVCSKKRTSSTTVIEQQSWEYTYSKHALYGLHVRF